MNLYFLVEGKSERKIYPSWLQTLLPRFQRVSIASDAVRDNYYLISGQGYPRLLDVTLLNAVAEINEHGRYDYLIVVVDADEVGVEARSAEIHQHLHPLQTALGSCQVRIVVQNCCIESWLLGNRRVFSRQPQAAQLREYIHFFDVYVDDPEQMMKPAHFRGSRGAFHTHYLKLVLHERNISYSKKSPNDCKGAYYLQELMARTNATPTHLLSFQDFSRFCASIA